MIYVINIVQLLAVSGIIMTDTIRNKKFSRNKNMKCKFTFLDVENLIKSKQWKDEVGSIHCSECDYVSKYTTNVRKHIEAHHLEGFNVEYICSDCQRSFKSKNSYQSHKSRSKGMCKNQIEIQNL